MILEICEEAVDRLDGGIAEDIEDVLAQLEEEGIICTPQQTIDVRSVLKYRAEGGSWREGI